MPIRLKRKLRERGIAGTLEDLFRRLRTAIYSEEVWLILVKDLRRVKPVKRSSGVVVEDIRRDHLPLLYELNRERDAAPANERFARYVDAGFHGFIALLDGKAVGYYWWVDAAGAEFPDLREHGMGIELGPGEAYGSDFYVLETQRNGRLPGEVLTRIETGIAGRGNSWLWGWVDTENRPARWLYEMRGYEKRWTHRRKRRFFVTQVENFPDPRTAKGGFDVDR